MTHVDIVAINENGVQRSTIRVSDGLRYGYIDTIFNLVLLEMAANSQFF